MEKEIINQKQAAELIGVSRTTLYKLIIEKKVPTHKIGKKTVFVKNELLDYIKSN